VAGEALLEVRDLHKSFITTEGRRDILRGASFAMEQGETVALTGESGSGKSTLLGLISGLDRADAGEIRVAGISLAGLSDRRLAELRRTQVGMVFQQFNLIPSLDTYGNLAFQARLAGRFDPSGVKELAARLGLDRHLHHYPEQLSGGQQQRVAIGRTIAARPALVLADEPTGNLDEATADGVLDLLLELVRDTGAGLLMVTHSERMASRLGRRLHLASGRIG
jgi:putative ABC transport system ATP-binding protein